MSEASETQPTPEVPRFNIVDRVTFNSPKHNTDRLIPAGKFSDGTTTLFFCDQRRRSDPFLEDHFSPNESTLNQMTQQDFQKYATEYNAKLEKFNALDPQIQEQIRQNKRQETTYNDVDYGIVLQQEDLAADFDKAKNNPPKFYGNETNKSFKSF